MTKISKIIESVVSTKARSAWGKGVKAYALELLSRVVQDYGSEYELNSEGLETLLLNGAKDWKQYSDGGCSLVCDCHIAERLCTLSELKKTDNGSKKPNKNEDWLNVQARALYQAYLMIKDLLDKDNNGGMQA